jgi:hypothetical protein
VDRYWIDLDTKNLIEPNIDPLAEQAVDRLPFAIELDVNFRLRSLKEIDRAANAVRLGLDMFWPDAVNQIGASESVGGKVFGQRERLACRLKKPSSAASGDSVPHPRFSAGWRIVPGPGVC